jgi:hypothetical protein
VAWRRGKSARVPLFETTPLRPLAEVSVNGQRFPLSVTGHRRERRDRVRLAGERRAGEAGELTLKAEALVEGRQDRLFWRWQIRAGRYDAKKRKSVPLRRPLRGDVALFLPLAPGCKEILTLSDGVGAGARSGLAVWRDGVAITLVAAAAGDGSDAAGAAPCRCRSAPPAGAGSRSR